MTVAQQKIKTVLGENFEIVAEFCFLRKRYRELGMKDEDVIPEIAKSSDVSEEDVKQVYAALDVYDKYF